MPDLKAFTDASRYIHTGKGEEYFWVDYGFALFLSTVKTFTNEQMWMFAIAAFINIFVAVWFCRRFSPEPILSFCLFMSWYFYSTIGAMRHGICSRGIYAFFGFVLERKWLRAATIWSIGISVHKVLLMLAPFYFAFKWFGYRTVMLPGLIVCLMIAFIGGGAFFLTFELLGDWMPISLLTKLWSIETPIWFRRDQFGGPVDLMSGLLLKSVMVCFALIYFTGMEKRFPGYNIFAVLHFRLLCHAVCGRL